MPGYRIYEEARENFEWSQAWELFVENANNSI